jgi:DNA-binding MarR family transcriptional regulator
MTVPLTVCEAMLAGLEVFRRAGKDLPLGSILAFLHVCSEEGIPVTDLAHLYAFSESSSSRYVRALTRSSPGGDRKGLVRIVRHAGDGRRHLVYLTEDGRHLRDEIAAALASRRDRPA